MDWPLMGLAAVAMLSIGVRQANAGILALDAGMPAAPEVTMNSACATSFAQTLLDDVAKFGTGSLPFKGLPLPPRMATFADLEFQAFMGQSCSRSRIFKFLPLASTTRL